VGASAFVRGKLGFQAERHKRVSLPFRLLGPLENPRLKPVSNHADMPLGLKACTTGQIVDRLNRAHG
jgi:hypothetical protein